MNCNGLWFSYLHSVYCLLFWLISGAAESTRLQKLVDEEELVRKHLEETAESYAGSRPHRSPELP